MMGSPMRAAFAAALTLVPDHGGAIRELKKIRG
jgi:hypothetical protein